MRGKGVVVARTRSYLIFAGLSISLPITSVFAAQSPKDSHLVYENEYVVEVHSVASEADDVAAQADLAEVGVNTIKSLQGGAFLVAPALGILGTGGTSGEVIAENSQDSFCADLIKSGIAKSCSPNYVLSASAVPNDPSLSSLWGMSADAGIDAQRAWDVTTGSEDVIVAIIDTGIDYTHPDLADNVWINPGEIQGNGKDDDGNGYIDDIHGANMLNGSGNPYDDNSHGTHVSGTIAGRGNNALGVVGVNWKAKLMGLKFLSASGSGSLAGAIQAINYVADMKNRGVNVRISNNSWGGGGYSQPLYEAIARARDAGVIFVAAAGNESNDNDNTPSYPGSYDLANVISVAAIDEERNIAGFSNYGVENVDIAAPGVGILSTTPRNTYQSFSGTSMATPHVSGALALLLASNPAMTNDELITRLYDSGVYASGVDGLVRTARVLNVARMVLNETEPLPPLPPRPQPCQYLVDEIGFAPDRSVESAPIVLQADELVYYSMSLPFSFPFHGENTNSLIVSPNGVVYTKRAPALLDYLNSRRAPANSIAPLHSDLAADSNPLGVRVSVNSESATVYWRANHFSLRNGGDVEIWATFYSSGIIEEYVAFETAEVEEIVRDRATIGLAGYNAASSVTFAYNSRKIRDRLGLRYTPICADPNAPAVAVNHVALHGVGRNGAVIPRAIPGMPISVSIGGSGSGAVSVLASFDGRSCPGAINATLNDGSATLSGALPHGTRSFKRLRLKAQAAKSSLAIGSKAKGARRKERSVKQRRVSSSQFHSLCGKLLESFAAQ